MGTYGLLVVIELLRFPPVNNAFFSLVFKLVGALGEPGFVVAFADGLFRFWRDRSPAHSSPNILLTSAFSRSTETVAATPT